jgi:hypothetical protein
MIDVNDVMNIEGEAKSERDDLTSQIAQSLRLTRSRISTRAKARSTRNAASKTTGTARPSMRHGRQRRVARQRLRRAAVARRQIRGGVNIEAGTPQIRAARIIMRQG